MRKLYAVLLSATLCCGPALAQSGPYVQSLQVQEACRSIGELGARAFQARPSTAALMQPFELRSAARTWLDQINTLNPIPAGREGEVIRDTVVHAFTTARDARQAYDYGWAACMDAFAPAWQPVQPLVPRRRVPRPGTTPQ